MKKLIPAICMLLIAASLLGTSTYAWFSMNKTVTATGMQVKASASQSLVISKDKKVGSAISVAFSAAANELIPATYAEESDGVTHTWTEDSSNPGTFAWATGDTITETSDLIWNINPQDVNASSGDAETGKSLQYARAFNNVEAYGTKDKYFYQDYTVYVAAAGGALSTDLKVNLTRTATISEDAGRAVSVDFYVGTENDADVSSTSNQDESIGAYKGTINFVGFNEASDYDDDGNGIEWKTSDLTLANSIPVNNQDAKWLKVTMRVYFDGAVTGQRYLKIGKGTSFDDSATYYTYDAENGFEEYELTTDDYDNTDDKIIKDSVVEAGLYMGNGTGILVYTDNVPENAVNFTANFFIEE